MIFRRIIFSFFYFFIAKISFAQGNASIKTKVDKNKILIGEPMKLTIEMQLPANPAISSFKLDSISHFELLEAPIIDSSTQNGNTVIKAVYAITSFDSGHWVIPSYRLNAKIFSDSIPVDVMYTDFDPSKDYHDIKDIILVKPEKKKKWWIYAITGTLILAGAIIYLLQKKKPVVVSAKPTVSLNAYDEAMKELAQLKNSKGDPKTFHSKLAEIFRLYVYRRKGILSLQKTTNDLVLQLKTLEINKDQFDKLAQALRLGDFVKFAKYIPSEEDTMTSFNAVGTTIEDIEKTETAALPAGKS